MAKSFDTRVLIFLTLAFLLVVVSTPPWRLCAFATYAGLLAWACAFTQVPLMRVIGRAALVLPFSAIAALGLLFTASHGGWILAGVVMKSFLGAAALVWLTTAIPFNQVLRALHDLRVPSMFVDLLALTYRYLFVIADEARRLRRAAAARGYKARSLWQARIVGQWIGQLFVRSLFRAERLYAAMRLRGYAGVMPSPRRQRLNVKDGCAFVMGIGTLVLVRLVAP